MQRVRWGRPQVGRRDAEEEKGQQLAQGRQGSLKQEDAQVLSQRHHPSLPHTCHNHKESPVARWLLWSSGRLTGPWEQRAENWKEERLPTEAGLTRGNM